MLALILASLRYSVTLRAKRRFKNNGIEVTARVYAPGLPAIPNIPARVFSAVLQQLRSILRQAMKRGRRQ